MAQIQRCLGRALNACKCLAVVHGASRWHRLDLVWGLHGVDGRDVDGHTARGPELVHHANDVGAQLGICVQGRVPLLFDHGGLCDRLGGCAWLGNLPAICLVLNH